MWLISNPLFEIGAGLVLIAATVWMLLNATAPRPALPNTVAAPAPPPLVPPAPDPAATLGPLTGRASRSMFLADEDEAAVAEPPLRFSPAPMPLSPAQPPLEMRLPEAEPAALAIQPPVPALDPAGLVVEPTPVAEAAPVLEELQPSFEPPPVTPPEPETPSVERTAPEPPTVTPLTEAAAAAAAAELPEIVESAHLDGPPALSESPVAPDADEPAVPVLTELPAEPEPPSQPFETRFQAWLEGLLHSTPGAPPFVTVTAATARVKRGVDPAWPESARNLRAAIECLGKLVPAAFAAPGAREATAALADTVGRPFALIWPEPGSVFDPARHESRSGEGEGVAAVVRPGVAYGGATLPALVVRGSASPSSASA